MSRAGNKNVFYGVNKGREVGVFMSWDDCKAQIDGFPGAKFKKFGNAADAEAFAAGTMTTAKPASSPSPVGPSPSSAQEKPPSAGQKRARTPETDTTRWDVVYSDGACKGNGQAGSRAGVGVWWGHDDPRNIAERCPGAQTNNRAELIAIIRVLESTPHTKHPLMIKTDSQYSIKCFKDWLPNWRRNGFRTAKGDPVTNQGVIRYLAALVEQRRSRGQEVCFEYVKGHSGDVGNDGADYQANLGAQHPETPERDWDILARLVMDIDVSHAKEGTSAPIQVSDEEGVASVSMLESPPKIRRIEAPSPLPAVSAPRSFGAVQAVGPSSSNLSNGGVPRLQKSPSEEIPFDPELFDVDMDAIRSSPPPQPPQTRPQPITPSTPVKQKLMSPGTFSSAASPNITPNLKFTTNGIPVFSSVARPPAKSLASPSASLSTFVSVRPPGATPPLQSVISSPEASQKSGPSKAPNVTEDELEAYADCLLDDMNMSDDDF